MAKKTVEHYILFNHELFKDKKLSTKCPIQFLVSEKVEGQAKNFSTKGISVRLLNLNFKPSQAQVLFNLGEDQWISKYSMAIKLYASGNTSLSEKEFIYQYFTREFRPVFQKLAGKDIKCYHRVQHEANRYVTAPCFLHAAYERIDIHVIRDENGLNIEFSLVVLENVVYKFDELTQFFSMLAHKSNYYILKPEDLTLLNKWRAIDVSKYADNQTDFVMKVLQPIEKLHAVHRGDVLDCEIIDCEPKKMIHLSELGGGFLMITPQFNYDGIILDTKFKDVYDTAIEGKLFQVQRNEKAENEFRDYIKSLHPKFAHQFNEYHNLSFDEAKKKEWFLKTYHKWLKEDITISGMDMMTYFRFSTHAVETKFKPLKSEGNVITFNFEVCFGSECVKLSDVKKSVLIGSKTIFLNDGSLGVFTDAWYNAYALYFKHGKISGETLSIPKWIAMVEDQNDTANLRRFVVPEDWWKRWTEWQNNDKQVVPVPKSIQATLRPYQHKGFEWMLLLSEINAGACLADDMGLGKTLQTITYMAHVHEKTDMAKFLIVCPASLLFNWTNEIAKFAPHLKTLVYQGSDRNIDHFIKENSDVLICSYATARNDVELLRKVIWDVMVLDESHNIRSLKAQTTKAIHEIRAHNSVLLSGTPLVNNTFDLFAQFEVILPGFFGGQEFFNSTYAKPIDNFSDTFAMQQLNKLTKPFILRRTKQQVAQELPDKVENIMFCEMEDDQRTAYQEIEQQIKKSVFSEIDDKGLAKSKLNILQGMTKLRQVCSAPELLKDEDFTKVSSIKLNVLLEEINQNLGKHKVLVFSQFLGMLDLISEGLKAQHVPHFRFDGSTAAEKRMQMVDAFQNKNSRERVFLISLKAGNAGITLTEADYVFLVDPWWNEAIQQQAIDRTHRIGQNKTVFAYKMICKDTIEERMLELQKRKQFLSDELIVEDANIVKNLTLEDVAYLFGG